MSETISHHIPDAIMAAYVSGNLPNAFGMVVAAQISMSDTVRASYHAHQAVGGAVLETQDAAELTQGFRACVMDMLDDGPMEAEPSPIGPSGIYPAPVMAALNGKPPKWKKVGGGVRQCILDMDKEGSVRLLYIPAGRPVPEHSHGGLELTLVLQGAFGDATGRFGVGDVEVATDDLEHQPMAEEGEDCICLAATDAPLQFTSMVPRLFQPFIGI